MKRIFTFLLLGSFLFSSLAFGQFQKKPFSGDSREKMKRVLRELIERKVKMEMAFILEEKRLKTETMEEILQGKTMYRFVQRVSHHPRTLVAIERYLDGLTDEKKQAEHLAEGAVSQKISNDAALKNYLILRARSLQNGRQGQGSPSLWTWFWNRTKRVLFEG